MKFDELDQKMRVFETAHDHLALPGLHLVARLDGRGFTKLTKEQLELERPFDLRFRDAMTETVLHLMDCGFRVVYGYHQSDEISLLFHRDSDVFSRKLRKYLSVLAGEASARFSMTMGTCAAMDCRISQLPTERNVIDYFRWRSEDAHRNALNAHCFWRLREEGHGAEAAHAQLKGLSVRAKNELLFERGINFDDLPAWQKRGVGVVWGEEPRKGFNPVTGEEVTTSRRRLRVEDDLPVGEAYSQFLAGLLSAM